MAKGPFSKKALPNSTSGSTGEPLKFFSTKDDMYNWGFAAEQRALRWAGYEIGNRCIHIGRKGLERSKIAIYRDKAGQFFERVMPLDAKKISSSNAAALVKKVEDFHPEVIRGITNAIYILARLLQKENTSSIRLKTVITTGEQLQDYQRDLFQKVFDCETFNHYGSWEFHAIAAECERHSGFHIAAENVIVEVVDEKDLPLPPGKEGRILVTGLHNYAMPFIRYEIGDIGALSDQLCPCGRGLPILASLGGRSADIILTRSGIMVSGLNLPKRFFADMDVEQYQIEQESYERIIVKIVLEPGCPRGRPEEISSEIEKRWRPILGKEIDIVPDFVDEIPSTASGKRRVVVSRIPSTGVQDPKSM
jgi:phenylacetate-CoA ligase